MGSASLDTSVAIYVAIWPPPSFYPDPNKKKESSEPNQVRALRFFLFGSQPEQGTSPSAPLPSQMA